MLPLLATIAFLLAAAAAFVLWPLLRRDAARDARRK